MNVVVNSQLLAAELRLLNKVVPSKPAIAILGYAMLTTIEAGLRLYGTDLEVGLSTECQASVAHPGSIVLPVARFLSLVEQFPDADVSLQVAGKFVTVTCGAFASKMQLMPLDDFPRPPAVDGDACMLDGASLAALIDRTRYAISATAQKFVLQGGLLTATSAAVALVTTDGKRIAIATAAGAEGHEQQVVVPMKALDALSDSVSGGDVKMTVGPNHLFFSYGDRTLTSRKVDGKFPKYETFIPRDNDKVVTVDRMQLASALRRATLVSDENRAVFFTIAAGMMELSSSSIGMGQAAERVPAAYEGKPMKVCANGAYILDFLTVAREQAVTMAFKDAKSAMLMTDGNDHVGVVMLMR